MANSATDEDVFPKWLQAQFNLAGLSFQLHDGSDRKYNEALVPCCAKCNNEHMSRLEGRIAHALRSGFKAFSKLRKADIFLWVAKIYYGLIHHEAKPRDWRRNMPFTPTMPAHLLDDLRLFLYLMQGFRKRVVVCGPDTFPFSILRCPLNAVGRDPAACFHFGYMNTLPGIALQLGPVGLIAVLDDYGTTEKAYRHLFGSALRGKTLHPDQFWELAGRLFYLSQRMPLKTSSMVIEGPNEVHLDLAPSSLGDLPYDPVEESRLLSVMTGLEAEMFLGADGGSKSILLLADRSFNELIVGV